MVWTGQAMAVPLNSFSGYPPCDCEPVHRCGLLSRLFSCGRASHCYTSYCSYGPVCAGGYYPYWYLGTEFEQSLVPGAIYRYRLEVTPLPPTPGGVAPKVVPKPITPMRTSASLYQEAVSLYWHGDSAAALERFSAAVERDSQDAATWYYKALTERSLGKLTEAKESARRGAALETLNRTANSQVGLALERVQGPDRKFLRSAMTADLTYEKALAIASAPVKSGKSVATK
jgi:hypothetical protein